MEEKDKMEQLEINMGKMKILKNLFIISFAFVLLFTAFLSLSNLQSSLNREEGLGTVGLAVLYGAVTLSCMTLPPFVIDIFGCKWTVALGMLCFILYMAANFYATWWTIIPGAIVLGLGAAPLWSAKCTYLTQTGVWYAKLTGKSEDAIINSFFGFFFSFFQSAQIWGNLVSSIIFTERMDNVTISMKNETIQKCGANNCDGEDRTDNYRIKKPALDKVYIVCGVYLACAFLAFVLVALCLDKIKLDKTKQESGKRRLSFNLLLETFRHLVRNDYQKLLIPITLYSGFEQAFFAGDFTRSYISCTIGIWNVGFVMMCYGVVDSIFSVIFGRLVRYVGHIPFFILAYIVHLSSLLTLLLWLPDPNKVYIFYIIAAMWGVGDAVIQTQVNGLYGYLFKDNAEAAFSHYSLWESVGFIIAFAYSSFICTNIKIYATISILHVGMILYGVVEYMDRRSKNKSFDVTTTK
ncbi:unc-93 A [Mactra antiquata]